MGVFKSLILLHNAILGIFNNNFFFNHCVYFLYFEWRILTIIITINLQRNNYKDVKKDNQFPRTIIIVIIIIMIIKYKNNIISLI